MREIITLQVGHYANYVGTHFWNTQESYFTFGGGDQSNEANGMSPEKEINHDVLFRAGLNLKGEETYTPRALIFDLRGAFRTLRKISPLYEPEPNVAEDIDSWGGTIETIEQEGISKNDFLQNLDLQQPDHLAANASTSQGSFSQYLEKTISSWTDFNKLYYHPKTLVQIDSYLHNDETNRFELFSQGREIGMHMSFMDDVMEEKLRFFVEECDQLQGFNFLTDVVDGFGGLSASLQEAIVENFGKACILTSGLHYSDPSKRLQQQHEDPNKWRNVENANISLALNAFSEHSSCYLPIRVPNLVSPSLFEQLNFNPHSPYHTSALIAPLLDTALLPMRAKSSAQHASLSSGCSMLNEVTNIVSLVGTFPYVYKADEELWGASKDNIVKRGHFWNFFTSCRENLSSTADAEVWSGLATWRGLWNINHYLSSNGLRREALTRDDVMGSLFGALDELPKNPRGPGSRGFHARVFGLDFPVNNAFPQIFAKNVNTYGIQTSQSVVEEIVQSVAAVSILKTCPKSAHTLIESCGGSLKELNGRDLLKFSHGEGGINEEEFLEIRERLNEMQDKLYEMI